MDPHERTIPRLVLDAAQRFGDGHFIEDGDVTLTFAGLADAALRAARAFCAAGIEPGDRVAIWAPNVWEWIVAALGLQTAGAVLVPLNTRLSVTELGAILDDSGARVLIFGGAYREQAQRLQREGVRFEGSRIIEAESEDSLDKILWGPVD